MAAITGLVGAFIRLDTIPTEVKMRVQEKAQIDLAEFNLFDEDLAEFCENLFTGTELYYRPFFEEEEIQVGMTYESMLCDERIGTTIQSILKLDNEPVIEDYTYELLYF